MRALPRAARSVLVPFVVSRFVVLAALVTIRHIITTRHFLPVPVEIHSGLLAWDAAWYRDIARLGYDRVPLEGLRFFPVFPLLPRAVSWLPGPPPASALVFLPNPSALPLPFPPYPL